MPPALPPCISLSPPGNTRSGFGGYDSHGSVGDKLVHEAGSMASFGRWETWFCSKGCHSGRCGSALGERCGQRGDGVDQADVGAFAVGVLLVQQLKQLWLDLVHLWRAEREEDEHHHHRHHHRRHHHRRHHHLKIKINSKKKKKKNSMFLVVLLFRMFQSKVLFFHQQLVNHSFLVYHHHLLKRLLRLRMLIQPP